MAFAEVGFYSETLGMDVSLYVILPEQVQGVGTVPNLRKGDFPVLYVFGTGGKRGRSVETGGSFR